MSGGPGSQAAWARAAAKRGAGLRQVEVGGRRAGGARAASARRRAVAGEVRSTLGDAAHLGELAVAMQADVDAGREGGLGAVAERARSACIERSSVISRPSKPIAAADHLLDHRRRLRGRPRRRRGRVDDVGAHRHRQVGERAEGREILRVQALQVGPRPRAGPCGCRSAARPWPGMCFITGSTPPAIRPSATARPIAATRLGAVAVGAVADHVVGAGHRHVEDGRAIDVDADARQVMRHQPGAEPRHRRGRAVEAAEAYGPPDRPANAAAPCAAPGRPPGRSGSARRRGRPCRAGPR